jgi:trk system potassium uptake protein TrkH
MPINTILFSIGFLLITLSFSMMPPGIIDFLSDDINWVAFAKSSFISGIIGFMLFFAYKPSKHIDISVRDTFILTVASWLFIVCFATLPLIFSQSTISITNAFFEVISGITTTGTTLMQGLDYASRGIVLWRALLQWLGGVGIIVMGIVIWPALRVGGMQIFRNEFSDRSEKIYPKISQIAGSIIVLYSTLTICCGISLYIAGMPAFDSICHALSTISTGGFSTSSNASYYYNDKSIGMVIAIFMIIGALTLSLLVRAAKGDFKAIINDPQTRVFVTIIFVSTVFLSSWLAYKGEGIYDALYKSFFQVTSAITTTGYSITESHRWATFPSLLLIFIMQIGGCTGSTSGSVKVFRYIILFSVVKVQIEKARHPHGIFIARYQGKHITDSVFLSVVTYLCLYLLSFVVTSIGLAACDMDIVSCISGSIMALSNSGMGFGHIFGTSGDIAELSDYAKWILMIAMIVGRLEYLTLVVLLSKNFWKK